MPNQEKRPVGRPKMDKTKSCSVVARVSPEDKRLFDDAAQSAGMGISEWTRNTLLKAVAVIEDTN